MTTALSTPPADLCPDLELVVPAAPEQSPCTEHPSDVPQGTTNAPATSRVPRENPSRGEGTATERHVTEDRRPEPWKAPDAQAEDLQEAGGVPSVPGNSPAFPDDIDLHPLGLR